MRRLTETRASGTLVVIALVVAWEIASRSIAGLSFLLPPFSTVMSRLVAGTVSGEIPAHGLATAARLFSGYFAGMAVAIPLGLLIGYFRPLYHLTEPLLELLRPVPAIAILPIAMLFLGLGFQMQTVMIGWAAFWPILISACDGVRNIDPTLINTARIYGYRTFGIFRRIILPASLPYTMAGLRTALTISLILAVFIEMITSGSGLGSLISHYREAIRIPDMYGTIIAVALLGYVLNVVFVRTEAAAIRWHHQSLLVS